MKWITREHVKVDRVACPWLIKKFVDENAEFIFAPADKVMDEAKRLDATPYDVKNVELGHHGKECSFEAILKKYKLTGDRALVLLGRIVNGADTDNTLYRQPEGPGLEAVAEGFRRLGFKDDHALNAAEWIVYDALYLDEPFSGLDLVTKMTLLKDIARLRDEKEITLVLVSHDPLEAIKLCRTAVLLNEGRIEEKGDLNELLREPRSEILRVFKSNMSGFAPRPSG